MDFESLGLSEGSMIQAIREVQTEGRPQFEYFIFELELVDGETAHCCAQLENLERCHRLPEMLCEFNIRDGEPIPGTFQKLCVPVFG